MNLLAQSAILVISPQLGQGGQTSAPWPLQFFPIVLVFVVFYFALIRPQQKKARDHAELLKTLKPGDKVLTSG